MRHRLNNSVATASTCRLNRLKKISLVCLSLFSPALLACGPDFPLQLTLDRQNSLSFLPQTAFSQQIAPLAAPLPWRYQAEPAALEYLWDEVNSRYLSQTRAYENSELSEADLALVNALRDAKDLSDAKRLAAQIKDALPQAIVLYSLGAVAFEAKDYASAKEYFSQVIKLPDEERASRSLWALYSLSRIELIQSQQSQDNEHFTRANNYLTTLQDEVAKGRIDPLRLSLASLGEQAYILLHQGQTPIEVTQAEYEPPKLNVSLNPEVLNRVITLYATQSVEGDSGGYDSLLMLSRSMMAKDLNELEVLLKQEKVQQLLLAYWQSSSSEFAYDGQLSDFGLKVAQILKLFPTDAAKLDKGDTLAAIYYQLGNYASAERMLSHAKPSGLTWWLSAKLHLQRGDQAGAAKAYAQAAKHFPTQDNLSEEPLNATATQQRAIHRDLEQAALCRIRAEQGVLSLERGEYLDALTHLLESGDEYWQDIAYVAERVLTTDELKAFVDAKVQLQAYDNPEDSDWYDNIEPINNRLHYLLGRRLLREGAVIEASGYFSHPSQQVIVAEYAKALTRATHTSGIERASAYWRAAQIAREHGMEILGFELAPDYAVYQGIFDLTYWYREQPLSENERLRVDASNAIPDKRFHYRYHAAQLADKASNDVPHNSQAYAALLCQATGWVLYREPSLAKQYYQKYVANGPFVPWAQHFGLQCETPDFASALQREKANHIAKWQALYHQLKKPVAIGLVAMSGLVAGVIALGWRRKHRLSKEVNNAL
ncbi:hypothetical protein L9G16_06285 [Shewanella sp. A25]|nr:hypothetical protein [Shewanella shenzhenensis]